MAVTTADALTEQFYKWERKGRGHFVAEFPAELEPPFVPFFGHFVNSEYVDDGKRHTFLSSLKQLFVEEHSVVVPDNSVEELAAFPDKEESPSLSIYQVALPKNYAGAAASTERCLTMLSACKETVSFEIVATENDISVCIVCREASASFVHAQFSAYHPECAIREIYEDKVLFEAEGASSAYMVDFGLREEFMRPIAKFAGNHDPYVPLIGAMESLRHGESIVLQVLFCGTQNAWSESIVSSVSDESGGSFFIDAPEMPHLAREKTSTPLFGATVRLAAFAEDNTNAISLLHHSALALMNASASESNSLIPLDSPEYTIQQRLCDLVLRQTHRVGMLLNAKELAALAHFPSISLSKKLLNGNESTSKAPLSLLGHPYVLGLNNYLGQSVSVGLSIDDRVRHIHVIGSTGVGKSTMLHSLFMQDVRQGLGCCIFDPHGDLIEGILNDIPEDRIKDVILIDPSDRDYPLPLNILSAKSDHERELLASDLVALFRRFSTSWGDQMHSVFANAIMAFLYNNRGGHLGDLRKFLIDGEFRNRWLEHCTDPELVYYWKKEYPILKTSSIGSILTRLDGFLRPRLIRDMVCQETCLDFGEIIDSNKVILIKLSQGLIGAENSHLLGALIVAKLQQAAMARQQQHAASRKPFFCYIDEFHHFVTPSMGEILSGARKFGFGLVLAHQDMQQVSKVEAEIAGSILSNPATRVCFRLGDTDARRMQDGFTHFNSEDLQNLGVGQAIVRVHRSDADCNISVIPWLKSSESYREQIINSSRSTYSVAARQKETYGLDEFAFQEAQNSPKSDVPSSEGDKARPRPETPVEQPQTHIGARKSKSQAMPEQEQIREHRYLQHYIMNMGQAHGYRAEIEVKTPQGTGQVDVLLEKGNMTIAFEISVTNSVMYEVNNLIKCSEAGYSKVVLCCADGEKLKRISKEADEKIRNLSNVDFLTPNEIPSLFLTSADEPPVTTKKGYRVKVKYEKTADGQNQELLKSIVSAFRK